MKWLIKIVSVFLLILPTLANAAWQVAKPGAVVPTEPFFQAETRTPLNSPRMPSAYGSDAFPNQYAYLGKPAALYAISVCGSLKENIERIMDRYHWRVVWQVPYDYNFDGRITGTSLPNVIEKLLKPFPLQAVLYMDNRTMTIVPRQA